MIKALREVDLMLLYIGDRIIVKVNVCDFLRSAMSDSLLFIFF